MATATDIQGNTSEFSIPVLFTPFVEETDWWQASVLKRELLAFEDDAMGWAREAGKVFDDVTSDVQELVPDSSRR